MIATGSASSAHPSPPPPPSRHSGGRPRLAAKERRQRQLKIFLNERETAHVEQYSEKAGMRIADYVRLRSLCRPVVAIIDEMAIADMNRLGGLFKMSLERSETPAAQRTKQLAVLDELTALIAKICKVLDNDSSAT